MRLFRIAQYFSVVGIILPFAACSNEASKRNTASEAASSSTNTESNTEEALSGGLELAQPNIPSDIRVDIFRMAIYKIDECKEKGSIENPATDLLVTVDPADPSYNDKCKVKVAHRYFGANTPIKPGKIHRIPHLPQGKYLITIKFVKLPHGDGEEEAVAYYGESVTDVNEKGEGNVEVVLKKGDKDDHSLIVTTRIEE